MVGTGVGAAVGEEVEIKHCFSSLFQVHPALRQSCFSLIAPQELQVRLFFSQMHSLSFTQYFLLLIELQATVGDGVGVTVGDRVGYNVGDDVGVTFVGDDVGANVESDEGFDVGA